MDFSISEAQIQEWIAVVIEYGLRVIYALVIWLIGSRVASWAGGRVDHALTKTKRVENTIAGFASSIVHWLVLIVVVIAILQLFGINATSLVAVLGAATLAIGLALQSTLSNFAAGVMLLIFRPFKEGDYVEVAGHAGTVKNIDLFITELATVDNVQITIPNNEAWSTSIVNYSAHDRRRLDMTIGVGYEVKIDQAISVIRNLIDADPRASGEPAPFVKATNLGDSAVDITLRVWCQASDYWDLKFDLTQKIKEAFDEAGVSIPYPHIEVVQKTQRA